MDIALDSRWSGPSSSPGWGTALYMCSQVRHFTLVLTLFTEMYNEYRKIHCWGNPGMDFYPKSKNTLLASGRVKRYARLEQKQSVVSSKLNA